MGRRVGRIPAKKYMLGSTMVHSWSSTDAHVASFSAAVLHLTHDAMAHLDKTEKS
jgi:hypothetical protein